MGEVIDLQINEDGGFSYFKMDDGGIGVQSSDIGMEIHIASGYETAIVSTESGDLVLSRKRLAQFLHAACKLVDSEDRYAKEQYIGANYPEG